MNDIIKGKEYDLTLASFLFYERSYHEKGQEYIGC